MKNLGENKRVVFLALSGIGNLIMQLPTIEALKKAHPTWRVCVWVAPRGTKEIALSQRYIDEVIEMPVRVPPLVHLKNILKLRKHHFDIGIVLSPGQLIKSASYLKLAGIPVRIGNSYPYKKNPHTKLFLTHAIDEQENLHDIEQNLRLLEQLNIHPDQVRYYSLHIPEKNIQEALLSPLLTKERLGEVRCIGIHAGCAKGFEFKRWPLERFAEVAKILIQKNQSTKILVFGGPDEEVQKQELVRSINSICHPGLDPGSTQNENLDSRLRGNDNIVAFSISAPLLTTAAIMQHCKLIITNDSGLMHIAAAVGAPTLGLFGPTDETLTGPRGPKSFTVRAPNIKPVYNTEKAATLGTVPHTSILAITPQTVIDKIEQINIFL